MGETQSKLWTQQSYTERATCRVCNSNKLSSLSLNNVENVLFDLGLRGNNMLLSYFSKYINQNCDTIISDILRFSSTWDLYAFGICYLKIIGDFYCRFIFPAYDNPFKKAFLTFCFSA